MIEARTVRLAYRAGEPILDRLSCSANPGEMVALTGPSGRGKSTLLYLLGLMIRPDAGSIWLRGERVDHLPDHRRARLRAHHFGFVFQDAVLDKTRSVLDNVMEAALYRNADLDPTRRAALALLEETGVLHRHDHRPGEISGGQAQRIAVCRALLADPAVVLADEPTGNLDSDAADVVEAMLRRHALSGGAVVIATHDRALADRCDREVAL